MPMDVSVETSEPFQVDPMETGPSENMEIPHPPASPDPATPEKRFYKSRSVVLAFFFTDTLVISMSSSSGTLLFPLWELET